MYMALHPSVGKIMVMEIQFGILLQCCCATVEMAIVSDLVGCHHPDSDCPDIFGIPSVASCTVPPLLSFIFFPSLSQVHPPKIQLEVWGAL